MAEKRNLVKTLSAWIRNLFELGVDVPEINIKCVKDVENSIPEYNPSDKQYLFLRNISRKSKYPGDSVNIFPEIDYPLAWANEPREVLFYIRFLVERGLLVLTSDSEGDFPSLTDKTLSVTISSSGWEYLEQFEQRAVELSQAYVAMSFSKEMNMIWEKAIKPAINDAGYKSCRYENKRQLDKINEKIITEIKNSLFVVAEVSEKKQTVYFEAGYAMGRNLPVIWCAKKNILESVHFDTKHYNHISWNSPNDLRDKLYDMICIMIGRRKKI
jgi:nucleoside 2-deoxyribosyltransferase